MIAIQNENITTTPPLFQRSVDPLNQPQNAQDSSGCLRTCLMRIWICLIKCFRTLFGIAENTQRRTRSSMEEMNTIQQTTQTRIPVVAQIIDSESMERAQKKLEEGIDTDSIPMEKLHSLVSKIQVTCLGTKNEKDDDIIWYRSAEFVFSFKSISNLIFKMYRPGVGTGRGKVTLWGSENAQVRYTNMIKAQAVCTKHNLSLIVIPHAKKISVDKETLIVEERMDINTNSLTHYTLPGLDETIRQFAIFIAETQFNDVKLSNMVIQDVDPTFMGSRRIALFDLESMESASEGFYGRGLNGSPGLIGCLFTEHHIDIALKVAERYGYLAKPSLQQVKEERTLEIQKEREFYTSYGKPWVHCKV